MEGTYVLERHENCEAFMECMGVPAEMAAALLEEKPTIELALDGDVLSTTSTCGDKVVANEITFDQECPVKDGELEMMMFLSRTPEGYAGTLRVGDKCANVSTEQTDDGLIQTMEIDGNVAKRFFVKQ